MTDDELRKLAEAALKDRAACSDGNWEPHWDGTLGRSSVFVKPPEGGPCLAQVIVMRRGFGGIAPEGYWIAAARTREPELARAVLRLLEERGREVGERFLSWRGVEVPCKRCGGVGRCAYANTTTWRGGSGGQMMTDDVCDGCWGTGDAHRKGADLRRMIEKSTTP